MTYHMEENLGMPLSKILIIMQRRIMRQSTYFGIKAIKSPIDFWVYQEIICETRPDVIIEIGNAYGGSMLALAHLCDLLGKGRVIGVDLSHAMIAECVRLHPRVTLIEGDALQSFEYVASLVSPEERVLVIEDSSHAYNITLDILRTYSALLQIGDYLIVEDSICRHGLPEGPRPGPYDAIEAFVNENPDFSIDRSKESFLITWNPKGYLTRAKPQKGDIQERASNESSKFSTRLSFYLFVPPILIHWTRKIKSMLYSLRL